MRILVTEDDQALSQALRFALTQAGYAVDHVADGIAADRALREDVFGLLILDLGIPKLDGFEVLRRLRRRNLAVPVLILSGRETAEDKVRGLDFGADDYLVKPFSIAELLARVRALLRRGAGAAVIQHGSLTFDTIGRTAAVSGRALSLSAHETSVLEVLLLRFGRVVSKEQLIEQLYRYNEAVTHNVIEVYVHRLRRKMAGAGLSVRTMYGRGYVLELECETERFRVDNRARALPAAVSPGAKPA